MFHDLPISTNHTSTLLAIVYQSNPLPLLDHLQDPLTAEVEQVQLRAQYNARKVTVNGQHFVGLRRKDLFCRSHKVSDRVCRQSAALTVCIDDCQPIIDPACSFNVFVEF